MVFQIDFGNSYKADFALINCTNIKYGSGIFSSKSSIDHTGMGLDVQALDSLINGKTTKQLRFVRYSSDSSN